jgi:methionyl-tRNA synthetase
MERLGLAAEERRWPTPDMEPLDLLTPGEAFTPPDVLFKKIEDADVAAWAARFGGG